VEIQCTLKLVASARFTADGWKTLASQLFLLAMKDSHK